MRETLITPLPAQFVGTKWREKKTGFVVTIVGFWRKIDHFLYEYNGPEVSKRYIGDRMLTMKELEDKFIRI